jgi:ferredoxin-NADP reductase
MERYRHASWYEVGPMPTPAAWQELDVAEVVQETPRDRTLVFRVPEDRAEAFRFRPGQFVTLRDPAWDPKIQRAYSISSSPLDGGTFTITVREMGRTGEHLYATRPGHRFQVFPPRGAFVLAVPPGERLVLLAGGSGVAPYRSFVRFLRAADHRDPVLLVVSARTPEELVFDSEFRAHASACPWFTYVPTVTRGEEAPTWTGRRGRVDEALLRSHVPDPARAVVYACGPTEFVEAMTALADRVGVPPARVKREKWG